VDVEYSTSSWPAPFMQQMKNHCTSLPDITAWFMSRYTPPRMENNWLEG